MNFFEVRNNMRHFKNTREVVIELSKHITGSTLDFGAGTAKYRSIIRPKTSSYTTFDMIPGEHIDVVGDALNPPFPDHTFNTVLSTQTFEHLEQPWVVVDQIKRILKPGGVCIITAPFLVPYHADPYDFFRYTKEGLRSLFQNAGFEIVEYGTYGNTPIVLTEMFHFAHASHYKRTRLRWLRNKLMRALKAIAMSVDRIFKNDAVYANVFLIAKKPEI